jgi:hypothetical protein
LWELETLAADVLADICQGNPLPRVDYQVDVEAADALMQSALAGKASRRRKLAALPYAEKVEFSVVCSTCSTRFAQPAKSLHAPGQSFPSHSNIARTPRRAPHLAQQ